MAQQTNLIVSNKTNVSDKNDKKFMVSRRRFLGGLVAASAALALPLPIKKVLALTSSPSPVYLPPQRLRPACSANINGLIQNHVERYSVARRLLLIDELSQSCLPRYERDPGCSIIWCPGSPGGAEMIVEGEELLIPTWEIATNPTISLREAKRSAWLGNAEYLKTYIRTVGDSIAKVENNALICMLEKDHVIIKASKYHIPDWAQTDKRSKTVPVTDDKCITILNRAFREIEQHDIIAYNLVCNHKSFSTFLNSCEKSGRPSGDYWSPAKDRVISAFPTLLGDIYTADIHVINDSRLDDCMYLTPSPDYCGAMAIRQHLFTIPADDPINLRLGYLHYEDLGMFIVDSKLTVKMDFSN